VTIKSLPGVARNFNWSQNGKQFMTLFCRRNYDDVTEMNHNWILKFDFVIISLRNHNLDKLRNFRSSSSKIKRRWVRRAPSASRSFKICH